MFESTVERPIDGKRRFVLPVGIRGQVEAGESLFCFPSIEFDCLEGGGPKLKQSYKALIDGFTVGHPLRSAIETSVLGQLESLTWDTAGRVTLSERHCAMFGITEWVSVVGLGDRFQIWSKAAFDLHCERQRLYAREHLPAHFLRQSGVSQSGVSLAVAS